MSQAIKTIVPIAVEVLAQHEIAQTIGKIADVQTWRVRRPGTSMYAFTVTVIPDQALLILTGDLGCAMWQRDRDMVAWTRAAVKDVDYLASKMVAPLGKAGARVYCEDAVREVINEAISAYAQCNHDALEELQDILDGLDAGEPWDPGHVKQLMYDTGYWDEFPGVTDWDSQFIWRWQCLKKWVELINAGV